MNAILSFLRRYFLAQPARNIKRLLPKGLFGRTLLIVVIPTILALAVATFVFFDRHWYTTTDRLTHAVAGDVGLSLEILRRADTPEQRLDLVRLISKKTDLIVTFQPEGKLPRRIKRTVSPLRDILKRSVRERVAFPSHVDMRRAPDAIAVLIETPEGLYTFLVPERRIYTPTTEVFIGWMVGSSILLSAISLLFMRNQVRPVRRMAEAAEAIGKGQDVPWFKPEGATEVRQASAALIVMRDRLRRAMNQRTAMLAGVSHDLRTPLTRMKLQLAMMQESAAVRGFQSDIAEMESMLEAYLAFARGEESEQAEPVDLGDMLSSIVEAMKRQTPNVAFQAHDIVKATVRPNTMRRCLTNLIANAVRYGEFANISLQLRDDAADIFIDDKGPGIPPEKREDVFRPFFRLDESRNPEKGGVGLGLTIARDIARAHGGDIQLETSPQGGLRAHVWLPV